MDFANENFIFQEFSSIKFAALFFLFAFWGKFAQKKERWFAAFPNNIQCPHEGLLKQSILKSKDYSIM
jgi:hypothetical protein